MNKLVSNFGKRIVKAGSAIKNAPKTPKVMMITGVTAIVGAGVFACVQTTKLGDKLDAGEKADIQNAIDKLKETLKGDNVEAIKADTESLEKAFYAVSEKLYRAASADGQGGAGPEQGPDGTYYNTDFEDKTDK